MPDPIQEKVCSKCKKPYPATPEYFHRDKSQKDGLYWYCKSCWKKYRSDRYLENRKDVILASKMCAWCETEFTPKFNQQKFCNTRCRSMASQNRLNPPSTRESKMCVYCAMAFTPYRPSQIHCNKRCKYAATQSRLHPKKTRESNPEKVCSKCKKPYPCTEEYFQRKGGSRKGLVSVCKPCTKKLGAISYLENREKVLVKHAEWEKAHLKERNAYKDNWRKDHPDVHNAKEARRRARKRGSPVVKFTAKDWLVVKEAYGFRCAYCRRKSKKLTMDHVIPLSKGGNHTLENICPCCRSCNSRKGNRPAPVFQPSLLC